MDIFADGMTRSMHKVIAEPSFLDKSPRCVVHLKSANLLARCHSLLHPLDRRVSRAADDRKYVLHLRRRLPADSRPCDVVVHRAVLVQLRPQIDQNEIAFPYGRARDRGGLVMGIGSVLVRSYDRAMIGEQPGL